MVGFFKQLPDYGYRAKVKAYELSQQQEAWLQNFDFEANQKLLSSTLDLVPLEEIEAVQRGQVEKFRQHNLNLVNIQNGIVKPKVVKKLRKMQKKGNLILYSRQQQ